MYSETDLDSAVAAGALTGEAAEALRAHVSAQRATPLVDEENFRLLTGFNDIFVSIAGILLLVGVNWIGGTTHTSVGAALTAATAWGLAEYFTRIRRMALPSIIFLLAFVGGVFFSLASLINFGFSSHEVFDAIKMAGSAAIAAGAAWLHWRRFQVPITIAAGTAAAGGVFVSLVAAVAPDIESYFPYLIFLVGLAVFALAMWWDISDPTRRTRRSDVAFWLHLLAAPMMVHSVFSVLGLLTGEVGIGGAFVVIALYIAMGAVALAIDRRALLVSALGYVLYAITSLFNKLGAVSLNVAFAIIVIGSALLLLSAFWQTMRARLLALLPPHLREKLPAAGAAIPQQAS